MAVVVPIISVTAPTPPRPLVSPNLNSYRLLYRGSLSLPDSHLLLDGLTFVARLDSPSKHSHLLQNPLALALESMRGRPSLRLSGVVKLGSDDIWLDESGGIEMDIHPRAILSRIYFENTFCLAPSASTSKSSTPPSSYPYFSDIGVKVALGDSDGPDTTEIVIRARLLPISEDNQSNQALRMIVARIAPRPILQSGALRLPRPDDPTPRKPPLFFGSANGTSKRELKRVASVSNVGSKRQKLTNTSSGSVLADLGSGVRFGEVKKGERGGNTSFKIPEVPPLLGKPKGKGKAKQLDGDGDVFGNTAADIGTTTTGKSTIENKGRRRRDARSDDNEGVMEMERANKNVIKRSALDYLSNTKDPTAAKLDKTHPEFKELFGWVYRGVGFALRSQMKIQPVNTAVVDRLVKIHVGMYIGGQGGINSDHIGVP